MIRGQGRSMDITLAETVRLTLMLCKAGKNDFRFCRAPKEPAILLVSLCLWEILSSWTYENFQSKTKIPLQDGHPKGTIRNSDP